MTFLVNDVLKHQAILLGNAEEPKKKKVLSFHHSVIYPRKIIIRKNYLVNSLEVAYIILLKGTIQ